MITHPNDITSMMSSVTPQPGVYLMKDDTGKIIYVGKAGNLKNRLGSYFSKTRPKTGQMDMKTRILIGKISTFETIITGSEKEALVLEANLIRQHKPRYNVILKDDKRYPSLRLGKSSAYPNLTIVRKPGKDGAHYFGPYPSAQSVRQTLKIIERTFKLRKCKNRSLKPKSRPCLNYQMGTCLAPCFKKVDPAVYREVVKEVILFLKGRTPDLLRKIKNEMAAAAEIEDFERAAVLRDKLFSLERTLEKQVAVTTDFKDRDVIGLSRSPDVSLITILTIRSGYLLGTRQFDFGETLATDSEMIGTFLRQYYDYTSFIPTEILTPIGLEDSPLLGEWLQTRKGRKVDILQPRRGEKLRLITMARDNADKRLEDRLSSAAAQEDKLQRLQKHLKLDRMPWRIECFDNSSLGGTAPVSAMVVFEKGRPKKSDYRKYKIRSVSVPDDYGSMAEVLRRRYRSDGEAIDHPDLVVVDGGKGQLNVALAIVRELDLEGVFNIIGIAKKDEARGETEDKIYTPGRSNPISFSRGGDLLLFLQAIRDEAHRFAITFHRQRRSVNALTSALDAIPGIGKQKKTILLKHFGGIKKIRSARIETLTALPGINQKLAEVIKRHLSRR